VTNVVPELVARGATGKRTGAGFYLWPKERKLRFKKSERRPNPDVYRLVGDPTPQVLGQDAIQDRLVLLFVNEAIRCLDEGVLRSPTDGDLGAVLGVGFPPFRGGPFHYADALGARLIETLHRLADAHGPRYAPADALSSGRRFFEE
jgi:3-hydroxyacyl-CoA dehydrogenase / enoyl-CoA hydratase / 3-hydroxybutyryl-CoA epimerase